MRLDNVAESVDAGDALHVRADAAHVVLNPVRHAIDRGRVMGGRFDAHPLQYAVEDFLGIDTGLVGLPGIAFVVHVRSHHSAFTPDEWIDAGDIGVGRLC